MPRRLYRDPHWALTIIVVSLTLAFGAFVYAIMANRDTSRALCEVLYGTIASSGALTGKPGTPGYAYYRQHPMELAAARRQNRELLRDLPCDPVAGASD